MSKIATYPSADTPLQLSDRLIGTEAIRMPPSLTPLATKNFSLGELLQLFSSEFPAASLQAVLNTGNTATQNITLIGAIDATLIKPRNIEDTSGSQGVTFQFLSKGTSSISWVDLPISNLQSVLNAGNTATQNIVLIGNITTTKVIPGNIQDDTLGIGIVGQVLSKSVSGIKWIDSPIYTVPTLGDVLSMGNTAINDIILKGDITSIKSIPKNIQDENTNIGIIGQVLTKSSTGIIWANSSGGVPTSRQLTINGIMYDLSANRSWNVGDLLSSGSYANPSWITSLAYSKLTGAPTIPTIGTWGALDYPIWSIGTPFVKMNAAGTFTLDTNVYLTSITSSNVITALGYTPVTDSRTLTINGVTYDLSANRSWTISTSPLTTKGDLYTFNSGDTRLPIGLNSQVLTVDTSTATGLKWSAPSTPTPLGYYGAFQDLLTQTLAVANVGQPFLIRTLDEANQVSITTNGSGQLTRITPANTGVYNIQWSGQFQNPDNAIHDVNVWFRKGLTSSSGPGTDVVGSNGLIAMPARKSAGAGDQGHIVAGWNFLLTIAAGEYVEFYWMSDSTQVTLQAYAAGSPPPSTASLIVTVTQQSGIMAGTGITAINSLTGASQVITTGTTGTNFTVNSTGTTHTLNLPVASSINTGKLSSTDWSTFNNKLPTEAGTTTTTALTFVTDRVYGTIASPEIGNITYSTTGALIGVTNIIIHNNTTIAPTFATNMKKLSGSSSYVVNTINYIYVTYINATEVIYSINQRT